LQQRCEQTNDADDYAEDGGQEDETKVSDRCSFSALPLQRSIGKPSIGELALGFLKAAGANRVSRAFFAGFSNSARQVASVVVVMAAWTSVQGISL
jgi:hypothetical protein